DDEQPVVRPEVIEQRGDVLREPLVRGDQSTRVAVRTRRVVPVVTCVRRYERERRQGVARDVAREIGEWAHVRRATWRVPGDGFEVDERVVTVRVVLRRRRLRVPLVRIGR